MNIETPSGRKGPPWKLLAAVLVLFAVIGAWNLRVEFQSVILMDLHPVMLPPPDPYGYSSPASVRLGQTRMAYRLGVGWRDSRKLWFRLNWPE